ncbi:hypothetical protein EON63_20155 [archaeon]|nr:MAG: hypothetical protein EON63_20155 [archaeon]
MKKACEYIHLRTFVEDAELLGNHKQYMFGMEPHDVLPLSIAGFHHRFFNVGGVRPQGAITGMCRCMSMYYNL